MLAYAKKISQFQLTAQRKRRAPAGKVARNKMYVNCAHVPSFIFGGHFTFPIAQPRDARALYGKCYALIDWLIGLPWSKLDPDTIDMAQARRLAGA
jgi:hypothetical protein